MSVSVPNREGGIYKILPDTKSIIFTITGLLTFEELKLGKWQNTIE